ncbi:hypothetical protein AGLY_012203, partial [Aphis glycines]
NIVKCSAIPITLAYLRYLARLPFVVKVVQNTNSFTVTLFLTLDWGGTVIMNKFSYWRQNLIKKVCPSSNIKTTRWNTVISITMFCFGGRPQIISSGDNQELTVLCYNFVFKGNRSYYITLLIYLNKRILKLLKTKIKDRNHFDISLISNWNINHNQQLNNPYKTCVALISFSIFFKQKYKSSLCIFPVFIGHYYTRVYKCFKDFPFFITSFFEKNIYTFHIILYANKKIRLNDELKRINSLLMQINIGTRLLNNWSGAGMEHGFSEVLMHLIWSSTVSCSSVVGNLTGRVAVFECLYLTEFSPRITEACVSNGEFISVFDQHSNLQKKKKKRNNYSFNMDSPVPLSLLFEESNDLLSALFIKFGEGRFAL